MTDFTDEQLKEAEHYLEDSMVESYGPPSKYQPASNNASRCGHPCAFYLWAIRARHEDIPAPDSGMPGIWTLGREAENAAKIALLSEGWNLHKSEVMFEDKDLDIRGKLDWELSRKGHPIWERPRPTEFKGVSGNYMGQLNSFDDCFGSPMHWVRLWPMQVLVYAYMMPDEHPLVCLLLRNKTSAKPRAILEPTEQHFQRLVDMGEVLAEVNGCLRDGGEPNAITYDPVWCKKCDAKHICPTMQQHAYGHPIATLDDATVIEAHAFIWEQGGEAKKAREIAWEEMKSIGKHYGLYKADPGEVRTVLGPTFAFSVSTSAAGKQAFKCQRIVEQGGEVDGG